MSSEHNKDLNRLLQKISDKVNSASSSEDLIAVVRDAIDFGAPLKFDNTIPNTIGAVALGALATVAVFTFLLGKIALDDYAIGGMFLLFTVGVSALLYSSSRASLVTKLSSAIFKKNLLLDNGLQVESDTSFLNQLSSSFKEFDRGNHSRGFKCVLKGQFTGEEHNFVYHYYHFHYVDSRTIDEVVSDGKGGTRTQTRTVYEHYDRYGIVMAFRFVKGVAILGAGVPKIKGSKYRPASNIFNKHFTVLASSELEAAKFLKPRVIIACEEFNLTFNGLNYEFNEEGGLCLSFKDDDLIAADRAHKLDNPQAFLDEITARTQLPKLNAALNHIHTLMKYSDNNFMEKSA